MIVAHLPQLPMLVGYTLLDNSLADGFSSNLTDAAPERLDDAWRLRLDVEYYGTDNYI